MESRSDAAARGVLCCGNLVYDTLLRPVDNLSWDGGGTTFVESIEYHVGGNGANTSRALGLLGVPVRLLGAVGDDEQGRLMLRTLAHSGVDTRYVNTVEAPTSATVGFVNSAGERKFFHCFGASKEALPDPIEFHAGLCSGMTHFHLASFFVLPRLRARGPDVLVRARAAGLTTSFDTNWDPEAGWMKTLAPCLPFLDILFMNEAEARMITGSSDPRAGAEAVLAGGLQIAVMKLGVRGCAIYTGNQEILCPAFDVPAKDTTGAGDCFAAGFLAAWMDGASLAEAGQFANAVAALSVQNIGAVTGVLSRPETHAWMRTTPVRAFR
ncbi:MAG: carbohydrate kinase family protein [Acidobacteriaceae bacterium]|nr:carbohydrate kinase family protein [Acidobacteriaceae bacterium]